MDDNTSKSTPVNDNEEEAWILLNKYAQETFEKFLLPELEDDINEDTEFLNIWIGMFAKELESVFLKDRTEKGIEIPEHLLPHEEEEEEEDEEKQVWTKCSKCDGLSEYGKELCLKCYKAKK